MRETKFDRNAFGLSTKEMKTLIIFAKKLDFDSSCPEKTDNGFPN